MNRSIARITPVCRSLFMARPVLVRTYATKDETAQAAETVKQAAGAFKEDGKIGKEFTPEGKIGGTAQKLGGPFDKNGAIGKQFTTDGAIGGTGQKIAEKVQESAEQVKQETLKGSDKKN
eukprot:TRINITY_DN170_c0_g1_i2.p1 TRINITY_DN170_c0_g1~~TRINITY_DN170_c0_g1_i2.p1  ORF type:complete len:120 (+),score=48.08 TRINITY_DN170_c0_g1_i2:147-506(+)